MAVEKLLTMVECTSGSRHHNMPVVAIGAGTFRRNPSSLHDKFAKHLQHKLDGLGIPYVMIDEYRTSQCCPRCFGQVEHPNMRVTHCRKCQIRYHRDKMASENMAILCREQLLDHPRPQCFTRKSNAGRMTAQ